MSLSLGIIKIIKNWIRSFYFKNEMGRTADSFFSYLNNFIFVII